MREMYESCLSTLLYHNLSQYSSAYSLDSPHHESHLHYVYLVGFPVFITVGVLANLLDLWVLSQPAMQAVAFRYLARLAASDLLYLLFNIPFCLKDFALTSDGLFVTESSAFYYAYLAVPIVNYFLTMSVYIIVWLSYDRWLAVCNPHKFPTKQSLQVVHKRCLATVVITFIMYVPSPLRQTYQCVKIGMNNDVEHCCVFESEFMKEKWFYIYEFIREIYSRFLPGVLITAFNVAIIITLRMIKKKKTKPLRKTNYSINETGNISSNYTVAVVKTDRGSSREVCAGFNQLTLTCCSVSISSGSLEKIELGKMTYNISPSECGDRNDEWQSRMPKVPQDIPVKSSDRLASHPCSSMSILPDRSVSFEDQSSTEKCSKYVSRQRLKTKCGKGSDARNDREICLVFLLLAITLFFYISSFPSALYKIMPLANSDDDKDHNIFRAVADVLEVSGHVFNFCLYFLLSPEFRRTLFSLLPF